MKNPNKFNQTRRQFLTKAFYGSAITGLISRRPILGDPGRQGSRHSDIHKAESSFPEIDLPSRPNVVVILADSLGYGDIGPYGVQDIDTPHLNRLADQGVRLTQFYANAPICTPTRAAFLTGRYPHRFGLEKNVSRKDESVGFARTEVSLAQLLKDNGYSTALFGKWHLGYRPEFNPLAHGFDEFFGILDWTVDYYTHKNEHGDPGLYEGTEIIHEKGYLTDLITDRAVSFIDNGSEQPFFLFVAYNAVLPPYQRPDHPEHSRAVNTWHQGSRKDYALMVERVDHGVGYILEALRKQGLDDNTLVIFTSDHGGEILSRKEPFFHHFSSLWEGGIRVPCILRWPGKLPQGTTASQSAMTMDLTASILGATGTRAPAHRPLDGMDILPVIKGDQPCVERTLFWRMNYSLRRQVAVRKGNWKYLRDANIEFLFDLDKDKGERINLAYRHQDIFKELQGLVKNWEAEMAESLQPKNK